MSSSGGATNVLSNGEQRTGNKLVVSPQPQQIEQSQMAQIGAQTNIQPPPSQQQQQQSGPWGQPARWIPPLSQLAAVPASQALLKDPASIIQQGQPQQQQQIMQQVPQQPQSPAQFNSMPLMMQQQGSPMKPMMGANQPTLLPQSTLPITVPQATTGTLPAQISPQLGLPPGIGGVNNLASVVPGLGGPGMGIPGLNDPVFASNKIKLRMISKRNIAYEGTFYAINSDNIILENVRSLGTENRAAEKYVAPSDEVHGYIIFNSSNISQVSVVPTPLSAEAANAQAHLQSDPAVLSVPLQTQSLPPYIYSPFAFPLGYGHMFNPLQQSPGLPYAVKQPDDLASRMLEQQFLQPSQQANVSSPAQPAQPQPIAQPTQVQPQIQATQLPQTQLPTSQISPAQVNQPQPQTMTPQVPQPQLPHPQPLQSQLPPQPQTPAQLQESPQTQQQTVVKSTIQQPNQVQAAQEQILPSSQVHSQPSHVHSTTVSSSTPSSSGTVRTLTTSTGATIHVRMYSGNDTTQSGYAQKSRTQMQQPHQYQQQYPLYQSYQYQQQYPQYQQYKQRTPNSSGGVHYYQPPAVPRTATTASTPTPEFDFISANAKFDKMKLYDEVEKKREHKEQEQPAYNKTVSFFDAISCESLEKKGGSEEADMSSTQRIAAERQLDSETFGVSNSERRQTNTQHHGSPWPSHYSTPQMNGYFWGQQQYHPHHNTSGRSQQQRRGGWPSTTITTTTTPSSTPTAAPTTTTTKSS
ncbi:protein LSM14 [Pelomyxa schiedti]|nr:protein LSM14 [Pelomyxa schiedti]